MSLVQKGTNDFTDLNPLDQNPSISDQRPSLINRAVLVEYMDLIGPDGASSMSTLVEIYISTSPEMIGLMEKSLSELNFRNLMRAAHTLKSSCASLGAEHLSVLCRNLENEARSLIEKGENPGAGYISQIQQEVNQIKAEFVQVCTELDHVRRDY